MAAHDSEIVESGINDEIAMNMNNGHDRRGKMPRHRRMEEKVLDEESDWMDNLLDFMNGLFCGERISHGKGYCLMNWISIILEMDSLLWMLCCDQDAWAKVHCSAFSIVVTVSHGQLQGVMCTVDHVCALCILCDSYVGCAYLCVLRVLC